MAEWADRVSQHAVAELFEIKNDNWLDEDEEPISGDEFIDKMRIALISVYPDGTFDFCHDDGDLFCGHAFVGTPEVAQPLLRSAFARCIINLNFLSLETRCDRFLL